MVLLLLALLMQDATALVEQLGDDDPIVRHDAEVGLVKLGEEAHGVLKVALGSTDPEVRDRAGRLFRQLLSERIRGQRPAALNLVTLSAEQMPADKVYDRLIRQVSNRPWILPPRGSHKVSIHVDGAPVSRVEELLRPSLWMEGRRFPVHVPGARFDFRMIQWAPQGRPEGWTVHTHVRKDFDGELEWEVAGIRAEDPVPFETCPRHSPSVVFVPGALNTRVCMTVRGIRRWYATVPILFKDPFDGMERKVGAYTLRLEKDRLVVRSKQPVQKKVIERTIRSGAIQHEIKPGHRPRRVVMVMG